MKSKGNLKIKIKYTRDIPFPDTSKLVEAQMQKVKYANIVKEPANSTNASKQDYKVLVEKLLHHGTGH